MLQAEAKSRRITCAAYAGSFLARYAPLPLSDVTSCLERLIRFATNYAANAVSRGSIHRSTSMLVPTSTLANSIGFERSFSTSAFEVKGANQDQHDVFYAACQAAMYSVCFHGSCLCPASKGAATAAAEQCAAFRSLVQNGLIPLMQCPLNPLHACLPTVTDEFRHTLIRHSLEDLSQLPNLSAAAPRRKVRCDTYFPFDPYLLPLSACGLKLDAYYRSWRHGVHASEMPIVQTAVDPVLDNYSESGDDSTLDGVSDEGDVMVGSLSTGQALDMAMLSSSADKPGAQHIFVNPFTGAPHKHVVAVRCPGADDALGHSLPFDGCDSPAYGSLPMSSPPGAFGPMSFK
jgi:RNA polymerase I specific transcription initiation factor RRN3